jgi:inosine-uridine nucleoside N-ribohydrolase
MRVAGLLFTTGLLCVAQPPLIVDTDAGADDLLALLWLTRQPSVKLEAVTVCAGLAHPDAGASTVLRLLEAAGLSKVPVYAGKERRFQGDASFPDEWRKASDRLLRDELPEARRRVESIAAAPFLAERLMDTRRPVRLLALGPLTNIAAATAIEPRTGSAVTELIWMGGAVAVDGNVDAVKTAEWNSFVDPEAVERVLRLGWRTRIIPLDATNKAPITEATLRLFEEEAREWAASIALRLLRSEAESIRAGRYYAWDWLAAMATVDASVVGTQPMALTVRRRPSERGRLVRVKDRPHNAQVAWSVDQKKFASIVRSMLP